MVLGKACLQKSQQVKLCPWCAGSEGTDSSVPEGQQGRRDMEISTGKENRRGNELDSVSWNSEKM